VNSRNSISLMMLLCALGVGVAACGSSAPSSSSSSAPHTSPSPSSSAPSTPSPTATSSSAAVTAITANWTTFFSGATPLAKRVSVLQNGSTFTSSIESSSTFPGASSSSAKVTSVTVTSPTQATVIYTILLAGSPVLLNQKGVAVLQDGTWKVGDASFCALLTLENSDKTPTVCKSVS
jgi:hypothetical protein